MDGFDPNLIGINFNIGHILQDGPQDLWRINLRYAMPYVRGLGIQDVYWTKNPTTGQWTEVTPEAGGGMGPWKTFYQVLLQGGYNGPADLQIEYSVTGLRGEVISLNNTFWADNPQFTSGNLTRSFVLASIKTQLDYYKAQASAAGWTAAQQT